MTQWPDDSMNKWPDDSNGPIARRLAPNLTLDYSGEPHARGTLMTEFFRRWITFASLAMLLPLTAFAADSSKPLFENDRVRITRMDLPPNGSLPSDNQHDVITVQVTEGETRFLEPG